MYYAFDENFEAMLVPMFFFVCFIDKTIMFHLWDKGGSRFTPYKPKENDRKILF